MNKETAFKMSVLNEAGSTNTWVAKCSVFHSTKSDLDEVPEAAQSFVANLITAKEATFVGSSRDLVLEAGWNWLQENES